MKQNTALAQNPTLDLEDALIAAIGEGLPLVKQIVTEHLGEIEVESEEGRGTTFRLTFPVRWIK